jgi:hypothetical protein
MRKYSAIISAVVLGFFVLGSVASVSAAGGVSDAKPAVQVTPEEAAKKYPPPSGKKYPEGIPSETANTSTGGGFFRSPYSSNMYDCRKIPSGALLLDKSVNKVFIRPKSGG